MCSTFLASANPRVTTCERCGRFAESHPEHGKRPRNIGLERELTDLAARSAGLTTAAGLDDFADARAWPGGVREDLDPVQEVAEELADARNYCVWGVERVYAAYLAGDSEAGAQYEKLMRALAGVVVAWDALVRG